MARWVAALSVVAFASAAAEVVRFPVRSEVGRRLSAPQLGSRAAGFELRAVHKHRLEPEGLVHVRHEVVALDARRLAPEDVAFGTRRDIVRTFMALNAVMYPADWPWTDDVLTPILADGDSLHGPDFTTVQAENDRDVELHGEILSALQSAAERFGDVTVNEINARDENGNGVAAMEFYKEGFGTVLAFRGTFSGGDYNNFAVWMSDWILTRMTAHIKYMWINRAGLEWTDEMVAREAHFDTHSRVAWALGQWKYGGAFIGEMVDVAVENVTEIDPDEVARTAYWEFTKVIARSARESAIAPLYLTGHSQGGSRAQLVSMYYEKVFSETVETITFAAVGASCFARGNAGFGGTYHMDLTADMDPFVHHPQMTDYTHTLDVLGFIDYDGGNQCTYGNSDIATSPAAKWCERVLGFSAADLMIAGQMPGTAGRKTAFEQCRYFTHGWQPAIMNLHEDRYIFEDGTTDGGCAPAGPISREDPEALCNTGSGLWETDGCNDQLSCETCSVSDSSDSVGFKCFWCATSQSCHSRGITWLSGCDSGYVGDIETCEADAATELSGFSNADPAVLSSAPSLGHVSAVQIQAALTLVLALAL